MDFLLALVAPVLTKVLYFAYLSGVATAYHLRLGAHKRVKGLPALPPQRHRSRASFGEAKPQVGPARALQLVPALLGALHAASSAAQVAALSMKQPEWPDLCFLECIFMQQAVQENERLSTAPRAPPNDPERQGNIWQRYEQLETTSQELTKVNQQIVYERNKYRKVGFTHPLLIPPVAWQDDERSCVKRHMVTGCVMHACRSARSWRMPCWSWKQPTGPWLLSCPRAPQHGPNRPTCGASSAPLRTSIRQAG